VNTLLLCLYDKRARMYQRPFVSGSIPEAVRMLTHQMRQPSTGGQPNIIREFADDYQVFKLGEFEPLTGKITIPQNGPELLCDCYTLKEEVQP